MTIRHSKTTASCGTPSRYSFVQFSMFNSKIQIDNYLLTKCNRNRVLCNTVFMQLLIPILLTGPRVRWSRHVRPPQQVQAFGRSVRHRWSTIFYAIFEICSSFSSLFIEIFKFDDKISSKTGLPRGWTLPWLHRLDRPVLH